MAERLVKVRLVLDGKEYDAQIVQSSKRTEESLKGAGESAKTAAEPSIRQLGRTVSQTSWAMSMMGVETGKMGMAAGKLSAMTQLLVNTGMNPWVLGIMGVTAGIGLLVNAIIDGIPAHKSLAEYTKELADQTKRVNDETAVYLEKLNDQITGESEGNKKRRELRSLMVDQELQLQRMQEAMHEEATASELSGMKIDTQSKAYAKLNNELTSTKENLRRIAEMEQGAAAAQNLRGLLGGLFGGFGSTYSAAQQGQKIAREQAQAAAKKAAEERAAFDEQNKMGPADRMGGADMEQRRLRVKAQQYAKEIALGKEMSRQKWETERWLLDQEIAMDAERKRMRDEEIQAQIDRVTDFAEAAGLAGQMFSEFASIAAEGSAMQTALVVGSILIEAAVKSAMQIAEGLAALATPYTAWMAPLHFAAAAAFAAVGAVKGAQAASGGGGGGARGGTGSRQYVPTQTKEKEEPSRYVIAIYGGAYFGRDAEKEMAGAIDRYKTSQRPGSARGL